MSTQQVAADRRALSHRQIEKLVEDRTEMLSLYSRLASSRPLKGNPAAPAMLQTFCQLLVDYAADSHFRLYKYIDEKNERRRAVLQIAETIYPKILDSTDVILDFNDKYDCGEHCEITDSLEEDLSKLGVALANRIELEDKLINILINHPKP
ncbi:MAG: hypothetical protein A2V90_03930 [Gammaproteobacteria bacterium RBG_16_57_12]|nr:MAG: hypothetical protein A2V90_03930 [Gammaproteobacteria bacterium RBG_16_57_12]